MLRCISPYRSSLGAFAPGDVITDAALAAALAVDSPASFQLIDTAPMSEQLLVVSAVEEAADHRAVTRRRKP